jgi:hypothetical protein
MNADNTTKTIIRVGRKQLTFARVNPESEQQIDFEPYRMRLGMSMAANMREAFKQSPMLRTAGMSARILVDSPTMIVPIEEFSGEDEAELYKYVLPQKQSEQPVHHALNDMNAVAVFTVNKDFGLVLSDHFTDVKFIPVMQPVWKYMHRRYFTDIRQRLFAYTHDGVIDVFAFRHNRFSFCNQFDATHTADMVYYILNVWKQSGFTEKDELFLLGAANDAEPLMAQLQKYLPKVHYIKPSIEFNRASIAEIEGITFDTITYFIKA